ncbi:MAG TPA: purine-nucleoside phosphorylase [Acidimicrobiales bacterium]|nr:purine-nucleoside phosphorylase [Acidimicrobiales bacterium]
MNTDPFAAAGEAARRLEALTGVARHEVVVVLGTGLAAASESLGPAVARLEFSQLPGFPAKVTDGQVAEVLSVDVGGRRVLVYCGRLHIYEGHDPSEVAHPVRTAVAAGCTTVVISNASGAIRRGFEPGDLVLVSDHLNLTGLSPLTGLSKGEGGRSPFVDLTDAWAPRLRGLARQVDASIAEGVYAQLPGPHFETPAEIEMLRGLGADLVGMSSVLELIAARHMGAEVLGVSVVTNLAAGMAPASVSSTSLVSVARSSASRLGATVRDVVMRLRPLP